MKFALKISAVLLSSVVLLQGCTTRLSSGQEQELNAYEKKGLLVKEKNPAVAATLGVLPMAGYFYSGNYVLAFTTIPLYPFLGPLWMPFDAKASADNRNYYASKREAERNKRKELVVIDRKLEDKQISYEQHIREQRAVEDKYSAY